MKPGRSLGKPASTHKAKPRGNMISMTDVNDEALRISLSEVERLRRSGRGVVFVDVRQHPDQSRIPGSIRYAPEKLLKTPYVDLRGDQDAPIVTYCT